VRVTVEPICENKTAVGLKGKAKGFSGVTTQGPPNVVRRLGVERRNNSHVGVAVGWRTWSKGAGRDAMTLASFAMHRPLSGQLRQVPQIEDSRDHSLEFFYISL